MSKNELGLTLCRWAWLRPVLPRRRYNPREGCMTRLGLLLTVTVTSSLTLAAQQIPPAFEVASIKINRGGGGPIGPQTVTPDGQVSLINTAAGALIARAYPDLTVPIQIRDSMSLHEVSRGFLLKMCRRCYGHYLRSA